MVAVIWLCNWIIFLLTSCHDAKELNDWATWSLSEKNGPRHSRRKQTNKQRPCVATVELCPTVVYQVSTDMTRCISDSHFNAPPVLWKRSWVCPVLRWPLHTSWGIAHNCCGVITTACDLLGCREWIFCPLNISYEGNWVKGEEQRSGHQQQGNAIQFWGGRRTV